MGPCDTGGREMPVQRRLLACYRHAWEGQAVRPNGGQAAHNSTGVLRTCALPAWWCAQCVRAIAWHPRCKRAQPSMRWPMECQGAHLDSLTFRGRTT